MEDGSTPNNELHDLFPSTGKMIDREENCFFGGISSLEGMGHFK